MSVVSALGDLFRDFKTSLEEDISHVRLLRARPLSNVAEKIRVTREIHDIRRLRETEAPDRVPLFERKLLHERLDRARKRVDEGGWYGRDKGFREMQEISRKNPDAFRQWHRSTMERQRLHRDNDQLFQDARWRLVDTRAVDRFGNPARRLVNRKGDRILPSHADPDFWSKTAERFPAQSEHREFFERYARDSRSELRRAEQLSDDEGIRLAHTRDRFGNSVRQLVDKHGNPVSHLAGDPGYWSKLSERFPEGTEHREFFERYTARAALNRPGEYAWESEKGLRLVAGETARPHFVGPDGIPVRPSDHIRDPWHWRTLAKDFPPGSRYRSVLEEYARSAESDGYHAQRLLDEEGLEFAQDGPNRRLEKNGGLARLSDRSVRDWGELARRYPPESEVGAALRSHAARARQAEDVRKAFRSDERVWNYLRAKARDGSFPPRESLPTEEQRHIWDAFHEKWQAKPRRLPAICKPITAAKLEPEELLALKQEHMRPVGTESGNIHLVDQETWKPIEPPDRTPQSWLRLADSVPEEESRHKLFVDNAAHSAYRKAADYVEKTTKTQEITWEYLPDRVRSYHDNPGREYPAPFPTPEEIPPDQRHVVEAFKDYYRETMKPDDPNRKFPPHFDNDEVRHRIEKARRVGNTEQ